MKLFATSFGEAWPLSKLVFSWLDATVFKARFGKLKMEDLHINKTEEAEYASQLFEKQWQAELKKKAPSLLLALVRSFIKDFLLAGMFAYCIISTRLVQIDLVHFYLCICLLLCEIIGRFCWEYGNTNMARMGTCSVLLFVLFDH